MPTKVQKMYCILLMRSQDTKKFSCGKVYPMDMELFSKVPTRHKYKIFSLSLISISFHFIWFEICLKCFCFTVLQFNLHLLPHLTRFGCKNALKMSAVYTFPPPCVEDNQDYRQTAIIIIRREREREIDKLELERHSKCLIEWIILLSLRSTIVQGIIEGFFFIFFSGTAET